MWLDVGNINARISKATPDEVDWLRRFLTFEDAGARFSGKSQVLVNRVSNTFPAGILPVVRSAAAAESPPIVIDENDMRAPPIARDMSADLAWLRDYQRAALEAMLRAERGIVSIPTSGGKSEIAIAVSRALPGRCLLLVHRTNLARQMAERYDLRAKEHGRPERAGTITEGVIGATWATSNFICATFGTIHAGVVRGDKVILDILRHAQIVLVDECFVAGTLIDGRPIETIRAGDVVRTFSTETGAVTFGRVVRTFKREPSALVCVTFDDGRVLVCTPNHRFWTPDGWVRAENLSCGFDVLSVSNQHDTKDTTADDLHAMSRAGCCADALAEGMPECGACDVLQQGMCEDRAVSEAFRVVKASREEVGCERIRKDESAKSDEHPGRQGSHVCVAACIGDTMGAKCARGQWLRSDGSASGTSGGARVENGGCCTDQRETWERVAVRVQDRYCEPGSKDRDRSGRGNTPQPEHTGARREENSVSKWARVASVALLESGSDRRYGGLCPDGHVYNFEVEETHTYFANGVGVSNCHVTPAHTHARVMRNTMRARYRFGFSGTPLDRADKRSILAIAMLGTVIYKIKAQTLVDAGAIVPPTIRAIECRQHVLRYRWPEVQEEGIVRSKARNALVLAAAATCTKPALVFVLRLEHGRMLTEKLREEGQKVRFVWSKDDGDARAAAIADIRAGVLDTIVCSPVFTEGADIPEIRSIVVAGGGKSVISALQRVGRGTRNAPGKKSVTVYDVNDLDCGCASTALQHQSCVWLAEHARSRLAAYRREGYAVSEERW